MPPPRSDVVLLVMLGAIVVRLAVGLHSYSGLYMRWVIDIMLAVPLRCVLIIRAHAGFRRCNARSDGDQVLASRRSMATSRRSGTGWRSQSTRQSGSGALCLSLSSLCFKVCRHSIPRPSVHSLFRYIQTSRNDLAYWGLDYPPLSAYQVGPWNT